ncbi:MAG: FAD-dependent monooxygenase, partial [Candidatus Limnocylindrales bacterium]
MGPARVAVVGAGPVGLTLAIRLAQLGAGVVVLDQAPGPQAIGSRAICMQRETLEIWARAGVGEAIGRRGIQWHTGRTYHGTRELFRVELPGSQADHFPPFANISQSEVDALLLARCGELGVEVRWGWRVSGLADGGPEGVTLRSEDGAV